MGTKSSREEPGKSIPAPSPEPPAVSNAGSAVILVIDDDNNFRRLVVKMLRQYGFVAEEAATGHEGLELASRILPDLILCDLVMPQLSGYDVLRVLRSDEKLAEIPVIFLTGQVEPADVRKGMNLGADDYLTKPAALADVLESINVRLARRQAERRRQEQRMERAMQLFAEIIHDLRNPLFAVFGYSDLLKRPAGEPRLSAAQAEQVFGAMQQAATRMQDIISQAMDVVRSRVQRLPLNPSAFDLRDFCEVLLSDYEAGGRVQLGCEAARLPVVADAPRLRRALENLITNGLKYSDGPVKVTLASNGGCYLVEVRDEGIGIPIAEQAGVFEPFFRASNTGNRPGHGLGLCTVKSCIEDHGGAIRFTSAPGRGTTFSIELPWSPVKPAAGTNAGQGTSEKTTHAPVPQPGAKVPQAAAAAREIAAEPRLLQGMVVEDDTIARNVLRDLLENTNRVRVVAEARTLAQARALARQQALDVVFLDINLSDGRGFDLLADLKPGTAIVFVSGAEDQAVQAFDSDATDFLLKPVSSERLLKALLRVEQRLRTKGPVASPRLARHNSFLVRTLTEQRLVKFSEITRIMAYGEYSWVYWHQNGKGTLLRKSLKEWEAELAADQFIRVHRRAIVNLAFLEKVERLPGGGLQVWLRETPEPIAVSLRQAPLLNRRLKVLER